MLAGGLLCWLVTFGLVFQCELARPPDSMKPLLHSESGKVVEAVRQTWRSLPGLVIQQHIYSTSNPSLEFPHAFITAPPLNNSRRDSQYPRSLTWPHTLELLF